MLTELPYRRSAVTEYAKRWAYERNPRYLDFDGMGGDCTNFASQCIYAGSGVMNFEPVFGWYYLTSSSRTASWTGVQYLYNFLTSNKGQGPYGFLANRSQVMEGDIVQLGTPNGVFYHSPVIIGFSGGEILVAAHTRDVYGAPLSSYIYGQVRFIHIEGVRKYINS